MSTTSLLETLWRDYVASTPQAARIHALLASRGETIRNDHVALRTFDAVPVRALARVFEAHGWVDAGASYRFDDKHLTARYWRHPDPALPKIFISELVTAELSANARAIIASLVAQLPADFASREDLPWAGRAWSIDHARYEQLLAESEYAAWVAAFGFRVNHFTVDVNALTSFPDLQALNAFLVDNGEVLNTAGGVIKGTPEQYLEQSSTRADAIDVTFDDRSAQIPSCYYEFARRYVQPDGSRFEGFVPASANKIFESTDRYRT